MSPGQLRGDEEEARARVDDDVDGDGRQVHVDLTDHQPLAGLRLGMRPHRVDARVGEEQRAALGAREQADDHAPLDQDTRDARPGQSSELRRAEAEDADPRSQGPGHLLDQEHRAGQLVPRQAELLLHDVPCHRAAQVVELRRHGLSVQRGEGRGRGRVEAGCEPVRAPHTP